MYPQFDNLTLPTDYAEDDPDILRVEDICEGADWQALTTSNTANRIQQNKKLGSYKLDLRAVQKSYNGEREEEIVGFMIHSSRLFGRKGTHRVLNTHAYDSPRSIVSSPKCSTTRGARTNDFVNYCRQSTGGGGSPSLGNT